ncbi:MAG: chemotaxis protein CheW [Candidatus Sumerlaeia bacterium]
MERQYSTFYLGDALFGIDILLVNEINRHLDITIVEQAPEFVCGLLNLRGQIVTVIDLGVRLGLGAREIKPSSRIVVLKTAAEIQSRIGKSQTDDTTAEDVVGLLVDRIGDMVSVAEEKMEQAPANIAGVDGKYISGVAPVGGSLMVALQAREILKMDNG